MSDDPERTMTIPDRDGAARSAPRPGLRVVFPRALAGWVDAPSRGETVLGRTSHARLDHRSVSREHLRLRVRGVGLAVADAGSHNGSFLDGAPLGAEPTFAGPGALLRLGEVIAVVELLEQDADEVDHEAIPGEAPRVRALRRRVARLGPGAAPVLLLGQTGTGKERCARELHRLSGRGPYVALNCAGLTRELADSQLFGHRRGAFTGAAEAREGAFRRAHGGSLFLDEVAELPLDVQAKLLRALESGEVTPLGSDTAQQTDVRVIAATHPDLSERVGDGLFRRDLYARLALAEVELPPLSDRRGDIPEWLARFDARWCETEGGDPLEWTSEAIETMALRAWPENLRGLDREVYRLRCDLDEPLVLRAHVAREAEDDEDDSPEELSSRGGRLTRPSREELERVLEENDGSIRATAKHYDRDRKQIYRWMEAYGLRK
ncbi:MAG: sigma 54-interacting transcriptional regulator [Sandaracinaceae bacterium]|nr:sigma 54-interacting transcriptional regulator [Sandaracinaceae bacterium]